MTIKKLIPASILAGITVFAGTARPQQEVAPDHFDGTDVQPQTRRSSHYYAAPATSHLKRADPAAIGEITA